MEFSTGLSLLFLCSWKVLNLGFWHSEKCRICDDIEFQVEQHFLDGLMSCKIFRLDSSAQFHNKCTSQLPNFQPSYLSIIEHFKEAIVQTTVSSQVCLPLWALAHAALISRATVTKTSRHSWVCSIDTKISCYLCCCSSAQSIYVRVKMLEFQLYWESSKVWHCAGV